MKYILFVFVCSCLPVVLYAQNNWSKPPSKEEYMKKNEKPGSPENKKQKDQGIWNDFHRNHIGKIVFSEHKIAAEAPDASLQKTVFDLTTAVKMRIYLEQSIANHYAKLEQESGDAAGTWQHDRFRSPVGIRYKLNGTVKNDFVEWTNSHEQVNEWTTWYYDLVNTRKMPWNAITGKFWPEAKFGEMIQDLPPGNYKLGIEIYLLSKDQQKQSAAIASGECNLNFTTAHKKDWLSKFGAQVLFNGPSTGTYAVTITNTCAQAISYTIVRPGETQYPNQLPANNKANTHLNFGDQIIIGGKKVYTCGGGGQVNLCNAGR